VLTSSPYKKKIEASKVKQSTKSNKIEKVKLFKTNRKESMHTTENIIVSIYEENWFCFLCMGARIEDMIQCIECKLWVHESCTGVLKKEKIYFCPKCKSY